MDDSYADIELETLVIKDKSYYRKKRIKCLLISTPIILGIAIATTLIIVLWPKPDNKIICHYQTLIPNENIELINIKDDINYNLIIDDNNYEKTNSYQFGEVGTYKVIFDFKNKLNSLEGFFEGKTNLI